MKGDPSFFMDICAKDLNMKIMDISSIKYHKEIKNIVHVL